MNRADELRETVVVEQRRKCRTPRMVPKMRFSIGTKAMYSGENLLYIPEDLENIEVQSFIFLCSCFPAGPGNSESAVWARVPLQRLQHQCEKRN